MCLLHAEREGVRVPDHLGDRERDDVADRAGLGRRARCDAGQIDRVLAGADVIGQNVDSPAAGQFAESAGVPWVGYDSNAKKFAKKSWLTAAVYNWGPYYIARTKAAMNGTWKTGSYYGSIKDGFTLLAPYGSGVSAATKKLIASEKAKIVSGKWFEFSGPIYDQKGTLKIAKGKRPTVTELYAMNWLVKGVQGSATG